uniref:Uncharacterized protein n=1 Tax=uncultured bacterium contig00005 TaxID=1181497 RepID=A0A806KL73_9BACT|nr:hypothetical protein [uncultured bacterium contig00005]
MLTDVFPFDKILAAFSSYAAQASAYRHLRRQVKPNVNGILVVLGDSQVSPSDGERAVVVDFHD